MSESAAKVHPYRCLGRNTPTETLRHLIRDMAFVEGITEAQAAERIKRALSEPLRKETR